MIIIYLNEKQHKKKEKLQTLKFEDSSEQNNKVPREIQA